ncbi:hypothetical protein ACIO3O_42345 [Streptomyces sp. NPDC087440]|uniref:hypothetical protein n=1 Tax=Streptomyces sp. NPDC087440 TaxID=3365790 RepID=UPI003816C4D9
MISEPELVGGPEEGPRPELLDADEGPTLGERVRALARLPWVWAVGGAVVASALWAGGLYAFRDQGPDQRGYRISAETCDRVPLSAISGKLGERDRATDAFDRSDDPAFRRTECHMGLKSSGARTAGRVTTYAAELLVEEHLKTDPGPELGARLTSGRYGLDDPVVSPVAGLGDRAFLVRAPEHGYVEADVRLVVQDGGVVLTLSVTGNVDLNSDSPDPVDPKELNPDYTGVPKLMESDMRELMAVLKK